MNLLLLAPVCPALPLPEFGGAFAGHMEGKRNPELRRASLTAWSLLAHGLGLLGAKALPEVAFAARGKPYFADSPLRFSLSHSGALAAALLSDAPCGVDLERVRPETARRLRDRCLSEAERAAGLDFFECWTRKECIAKLDGRGLSAHPCDLDSLNPRYRDRFFSARVPGDDDAEYVLSALCVGADELTLRHVAPEALSGNPI